MILSSIRLACVTAILAMAPGLALAYIDPGSGAYMVQALFTLVGAALFYIRHPIRAFRAFADRLFAGRRAKRSSDSEAFDEMALRAGSVDESTQEEST